MKYRVLGWVQLIVLAVVGIYTVMPDLVVGPFDDAALTAIAGVAEAVLAVIRAVSKSHPERLSDDCDDHIDDHITY